VITIGDVPELPLVGRSEELSFLREAIAERSGALLSGAAGVGKTRLAREVASFLSDWHVVWTTVTPATSDLPLGGVAGLGLIDRRISLHEPGLLARLAARLLEQAGGRRVLVVVDDAYLLDELSAAFVHQLVTSGVAALLATVRSGAPLPTGVMSLSKELRLPRLELQPLGLTEFGALVAEVLGGPPEPETLSRLWSVTAGNVLFVRELLADAAEAGVLARIGRWWRWAPSTAAGPRLTELVAERMLRPEGQRRALIELLAVGEPVGAGLLEQVVPAVDLAEEERRGLIVVDEAGRRVEVRLAHPLFGEVVRARLPVLTRRRLLRQLADALEATGARRQGDLLRLAVWRLESASATDPQLLVAAARRAHQVLDPGLAIRLARASLELAASFDARLVLGGALAATGRFAEAGEVLDSLAGTEPDGRARQLVARERAFVAFHGSGGLAAAERFVAEAEASGDDPTAGLLARAELALLLTYNGHFADALAIVRPLIEHDVDERVRLRCLPAVGACLTLAGRAEQVLQLCQELQPTAERWREELPLGLGWIWLMRGIALVISGRLRDAEAVLAPQLEPGAGPSLGEGDLACARTTLGLVLLHEGRPRSALQQLRTAAPALTVNDPNGCRVWCLSLASQAEALVGEAVEAVRLAGQATSERSRGFAVWDGDAARARAWADAAGGESFRAIAMLVDVAETQEQHGQPALALFALHDALRLGAQDVANRLEALASGLDGPFPSTAAAHATAVRTNDPARLTEAAEAFGALGFSLVAAEIAARAAAAWSASGLLARAVAAAQAKDAYLSRCETTTAPSLLTAVPLVGLTRREWEVAGLAARGLSNAEIARRLLVSVRTVESHLYMAYEKLGVTDRAELTAILGPGSQ
jgi:DNA-binding NarL/FixJ family response regulator